LRLKRNLGRRAGITFLKNTHFFFEKKKKKKKKKKQKKGRVDLLCVIAKAFSFSCSQIAGKWFV